MDFVSDHFYTPSSRDEANETEEQDLWPQLEDMYEDYKEYRARAEGVRRIPILIFTPVA